MPATSARTWPASASRARLLVTTEPTTSMTRIARLIANTATRRPRWAAAAEPCVWGIRRGNAPVQDDEDAGGPRRQYARGRSGSAELERGDAEDAVEVDDGRGTGVHPGRGEHLGHGAAGDERP